MDYIIHGWNCLANKVSNIVNSNLVAQYLRHSCKVRPSICRHVGNILQPVYFRVNNKKFKY